MNAADLVFYLFAGLAVAASVGVAISRNPMVAATSLLLSLFSVAALFAWAGAHFLAAMQVLVYAGAIAVLFVFVIMLLNLRPGELGGRDWQPSHAVALVLVALVLGALSAAATRAASRFPALRDETGFGTTAVVGRALLTDYLVPFEVISLLLVAAMGGAVMLTKRAQVGEALDAIDRARRRIDPLSRKRAFVPDPTLPDQQGLPPRQVAKAASAGTGESAEPEAPLAGIVPRPLEPGETL